MANKRTFGLAKLIPVFLGLCRSRLMRGGDGLVLATCLSFAIMQPSLRRTQDIVIPDEIGCRDCEIDLRPVARIALSEHDSVTIASRTRYAHDSHGHILAAGLHEFGTLAMFDQGGELMRTFGREGQGPGEFTSTLPLISVDTEDRVHVWEGPRHTILRPDLEGVVALSIDAFRPVTVAFSDSGMAFSNSEGLAGYTTHVRRTTDGILRGLEPVGTAGRSRYDPLRFVTSASDGFWVAKVNRFEVALWSFDGTLLKTVSRTASWFDTGFDYVPGVPTRTPPPTQLSWAAKDVHGNFWVILVTADGNWKADPQRRQHAPIAESPPRDQYFDTIIEAWNIERGIVLARERFDEWLKPVMSSTGRVLVQTHREEPTGLFGVEIYELQITQPNQ